MLIDQVNETIQVIKQRVSQKPEIAIVLGSGLSPIAESLTDQEIIPYGELPHFRQSTAPGHEGRLIFGKLNGVSVLCMQGRLHYYEGYSLQEVTYPIRVMAKLGIEQLILTNACGGLNPADKPGQLMLITDHINLLGHNPLIGPNEAEFGARFPDMSEVYSRRLGSFAREMAQDLEIPLVEGVYVACTGPSYETPAEIRWFQSLGARGVGMSTVPEAIVANHSGIEILGISCITNPAAGILGVPLTEEEVIEAGNAASANFVRLLVGVVGRMRA